MTIAYVHVTEQHCSLLFMYRRKYPGFLMQERDLASPVP